MMIWRLWRDIASCDKKKTCQGGSCSVPDWQIQLITQCAHRSVWCGLALVLKEVSGRLKRQGEEVAKPLQIPCLGVRRDGSSRRTWLWQSAMSSATVSWLAQSCVAICRATEGVFPGLEWCGKGMRPGRMPAVVQATSLAWFVYTNSTGWEGDVLERRAANTKKHLIECRFLRRPNYLPS